MPSPGPDDPWTGRPIRTLAELSVYLGGSEDSFTGLLLILIAKADLGNKARLKAAFPREVAAYTVWMACDPAPTWGQLQVLLP